jgi:hypothetical protein
MLPHFSERCQARKGKRTKIIWILHFFLDTWRFWHIIALIDTVKDCEADEYAPNRLDREQEKVRTCRHDSAEWTVELREERAASLELIATGE